MPNPLKFIYSLRMLIIRTLNIVQHIVLNQIFKIRNKFELTL